MTFAARPLVDPGASGGGGGGGGFTPVTNTYTTPGTYTETIPSGATTLFAEVGGPGGGGGYNSSISAPGGSGALSQRTIALTSADWGRTFTVTVQPGGVGGSGPSNEPGGTSSPSTIFNGTYGTTVNMQAGAGVGGGTAGAAIGGSGGVASGGSPNVSGNAGSNGTFGTPGAAVAGRNISSGGGGLASQAYPSPAQAGAAGAAAFAYT